MKNINYRYSLDRSSKKFTCPECRQKRFVRYVDAETDEYLPEQFGRCDREVNCGYHQNPYTNKYKRDFYSLLKKQKKKKFQTIMFQKRF